MNDQFATDQQRRGTASVEPRSGASGGERLPSEKQLGDLDRVQRGALAQVVRDDEERQKAAAVLDVLWSVASFERIVTKWALDS